MNNITVIIRYNFEKQSVPTQDDIHLEDLLNQLGAQGRLPQTNNWIVKKMGGEETLDLTLSLAENGVADNDVLDLALPTKAGAVC